MTRALFGHVFMALLGFALAALAAAIIISLITHLFSSSTSPYAWSNVLSDGRQLPGKLLFATYAVLIYALPGWLISVAVAEIRREKRSWWFAVAGVFASLVALFYAKMGEELSSMSVLFFAFLAGGFFGGLVYWAVAGRRSGGWRHDPVSKQDQGGSVVG